MKAIATFHINGIFFYSENSTSVQYQDDVHTPYTNFLLCWKSLLAKKKKRFFSQNIMIIHEWVNIKNSMVAIESHKFLSFFDHLSTPSVDIFDKKSTFLDYPPPSSCKRILWITLKLIIRKKSSYTIYNRAYTTPRFFSRKLFCAFLELLLDSSE